jgi:Ca-activated chloride channel homolog
MKKILGAVLGVAVLAGVVMSAIPELRQPFAGLFNEELSFDEAANKLDNIIDDVSVRERLIRQRANLSEIAKVELTSTLPDIDKFPLVVAPPRAGDTVVAELFVSTEKSGADADGWLREAATAFNSKNVRIPSGAGARIAVRKIASGTGYQFIASGKHRPDGFSPSNHLWIQMASAHGVRMEPIRERLVSNPAGVVMKTEVGQRLTTKYGNLSIPTLIDAVVQGDLVMGYTNPFASSTGLNFLVTVLATFANNDSSQMLSGAVTSAFESFQRGVPFVALTTLQMRESVQKDGSLDAFVMEYQTFARTPELASGYEFIPFGIVHDNPLYAIGDDNPPKRAVMEAFAAFLEEPANRAKADLYGFNDGPNPASTYKVPPGALLIQAQKLWKEKKDAGRPVVAVFLCDISGSMRGQRIQGVKHALRDGAEFIGATNAIGLAAFSNEVTIRLAIKPFTLSHKASFLAAVQQLGSAGNTAMYDGVAVALEMLVDAVRKNPEAKPLLFVLSDGATNKGHAFEDLKAVVQGLQIPIYTIGYEANLDELGRLSALVEAATMNADAGEIRYKIGALLNAQM